MIERDSTVLPEPDSPTTPRVLPRSTESDTPSTARTVPRAVRKAVCRSSTSSSGPRRLADVGELEARGADLRRPSVHSSPSRTSKRWRSRSPIRLMRQQEQEHGQHRPQHDVGVGGEVAVGRALGDHVPPRRGGQRDRQAEEGQRALDDDGHGHRDEPEGDRHRHHVGQDLPEDDPRRLGPEGAGADDELAVGEGQGGGPDHPVEQRDDRHATG